MMSVGLELEFRVAGLVMSVGLELGVQGHRCWAGLVLPVPGVGVGVPGRWRWARLVMSVYGVGVGVQGRWTSDVCRWG